MGFKGFRLEHWQKVAAALMAYDVLFVNLSYAIALWIRFDCSFSLIPDYYILAWLKFIPFYSVFTIIVFEYLKLYRSIWRFASYNEFVRVSLATVITVIFHIIAITLFFERMPVSYYIIGALLQFMFVLGIRFSYRLVSLLYVNKNSAESEEDYAKVMIIGAGAAGQMIIRDIRASKHIHDRVMCIIDDNKNKWNRYIDGIPVVGGRDDILSAAEKYDIDKIYLAIPSAKTEDKRDILHICSETDCELKNLPGMYQYVIGNVTVDNMEKVSVEDLLGRDPVQADLKEVFEFIHGKVILVTGGGGSIGSELCRQIAAHEPKQLIIFDIYENNAYEIQLELKDMFPDLDLVTLIGSVRDSARLMDVFRTYRPQIVYHAAAHKHVPLMEDAPCEAIKNNTFGTYKTAYAAMLNGCERFVLISTDKAVNPTNIMGASKRLCEMIIQTFDAKIKAGHPEDIPLMTMHDDTDISGYSFKNIRTEFVAVRFGNVLDSNGSVVPVFRKQIEKGGPVTVTHPDIIRYFMTIPEAVSLVLTAGTYAKGGEIFVLDMGSPVKIDTLARNLIKLSGHKPDVDIRIEYTGLRPGEKLFEEKLMAEEGLQKTDNNLIFIGKPVEFNTDYFLLNLRALQKAAYTNDEEEIRHSVMNIVDTYQPEYTMQINLEMIEQADDK